MERTKLEKTLWDIRISKDGCEILEVLAVFDEVMARLEGTSEACTSWHKCFDEACRQRDEAQAENERLKGICNRLMQDNTEQKEWLDRISEPIRGTQRSSIRGGRGCSDSDRETVDRICAYLDSQKASDIHHEWQGGKFPAYRCCVNGEWDAWCVCPICNPQKPSEKHNPSNEDEGTHEGNWRDCPICNPPKCEDAAWIEPRQPAEGELLLDLMSTMNVVVGNAIFHKDDPKSGVDYGDFTGVAKNLERIFKEHGWVKLPSEDELALWLCDHLNCTSRELAQELLLRLPKE